MPFVSEVPRELLRPKAAPARAHSPHRTPTTMRTPTPRPEPLSLRMCFIAVGTLLALHAPGVACAENTGSLVASKVTSNARRALPLLPEVVPAAGAPSKAVSPSSTFGQALVDVVNTDAETLSTCTSGFEDLEALKRAACPSINATVDWDLFDAAYAEAGTSGDLFDFDSEDADTVDAINTLANSGSIDPYTTDGHLKAPTGCLFGCIPTKKTGSSPLSRIAATLPWRGKCFTKVSSVGKQSETGDDNSNNDDTTASTGTTVRPTSADGIAMDASVTVPLVANVKNRVENPNDANDTNTTSNASSTPGERIVAPATAYVGVSTFDGAPALIIDYNGQDDFGAFRDEVRYVGCGVWLGKTYLVGSGESLAASLAAVGGVELDPLITAVIKRAMPVRENDGSPPWVLDFTLYAQPED